MTTQAFVGKVYLERGDAGSPVAYERVCQVFGIGGLGESNEIIEATTFCSGGSKEYIGGLADGSEVTFNANFETSAQILRDMIGDVKTKTTRQFRLVVDDEVVGNPEIYFYFAAACLSWTFNPSTTDKNTIDFGVKVSGSIDIQIGAVN